MAKYCWVLLILILLFETTAEANIVKTDKPYSQVQLEHDLKIIQRKYNDQIELKSIGTTHFGKPIWAVKLGRGEQNIVLIGSHHGREWLTSILLMKMLETYAEAYQQEKMFGSKNTSILNDVSIWFVPMLNPDGVAIQQNNLTYFPVNHQKRLLSMNEGLANFERWKANGLGIDLNRQYPAGWEGLNQEPSEPYYQFFKGKKPLEAKEVIALTQFIKEINPSIAVAYHTAGREIFWNYKNGKHLSRDYKVAKKIAKLTGYRLAKPDPDAVGGGFTDWFITTYRRPAMTIELSYLVGETSPPLIIFKKEWIRNQYVGLKLAEEAKKLAE
ncbi:MULTISPECIES: M14 family zinc carboxypeptidase [Bacillaceae]|uniref:M14 family zinc carboxypeptidase n=1 Tax=Bacillaceae TaxID=186817 RepID=UPI00118866FF|nr:M14 family zinc carboxypeptidase [Bacillus sp. S3]QCJ41623.1 carboxypeptidase [Bacillus sp. S3]